MVKDGDLIVAGQDCGWINKSTFDSWCKWFVSKTNSIRNKLKLEENAILILDGHNSRENPDAIKYLKENKVTLVILPSNSTHVLQPLDVSIFSPFKNYLTKNKNRYLKDIKIENNNDYTETDINRYKLMLLVLDSFQQSCTKLNIINSFQKCGIFPWNKDVPLNNKRIINDSSIIINLPSKSKQKKVNINGKVLTACGPVDGQILFDGIQKLKEDKNLYKNIKKKKRK